MVHAYGWPACIALRRAIEKEQEKEKELDRLGEVKFSRSDNPHPELGKNTVDLKILLPAQLRTDLT